MANLKTSTNSPAKTTAADAAKLTPAQKKAITKKIFASGTSWPQKLSTLKAIGITPPRIRYEVTIVVDTYEGSLKKTVLSAEHTRYITRGIFRTGYYDIIPPNTTVTIGSIKEVGIAPPTPTKKVAKKATLTKRVSKKAAPTKRAAKYSH